jgi:hypothetical protein
MKHKILFGSILCLIIVLGFRVIAFNLDNEVKQKYHTLYAPFIPSDFVLVKSVYDHGTWESQSVVRETYRIHRTNQEALAEVIKLFRSNGYRVEINEDHLDADGQKYHFYVNSTSSPEGSLLTFELFGDLDPEPSISPEVSRAGCPSACGTTSFCPKYDSYDYDCQQITIPSKILLDISGTGNKTTPEFTVNGDWDTYWKYDCSNIGGKENFKLIGDGYAPLVENRSVNDNMDFEQHGIKDSGIWPAGKLFLKGTFFFKVETKCSWSIKVKG